VRNKDDLRTLLVVTIVCVVCVVIALLLVKKSNSDRLEVVKEYNVYFSNVSYVNSYINCIAAEDTFCVYNLLSDKYINDSNVTIENVLDKVETYPIDSSLKVLNMNYVKIKNNFVYYIDGIVYENGYEENKLIDDNFSIILIKDYDNLSFSLYPVDKKNYKSVLNKIKKVNIDKNKNNVINASSLIDKEQICVVYLSDFVNNMFININYSYDILSDEMKKIYTNIDEFKRYINNNSSHFSSIADKCKVDQYGEKRVYSVIDGNNNKFVFTEEAVMKYKVDFYLNEVD